MIKGIDIQLSKGNNIVNPAKNASNPNQDKGHTDLYATKKFIMPYHIPLPFKGLQSNSILGKLKHNNTPITILNDIQKLPDSEKQDFVDKYCEQTGFPNLETVNGKIISQAREAIQTASKNAGLPVLWSGYHKNCSVSRGLALPGSDLDGWAIIVDGNQNQINRFKGELSKNTDPLFASIRGEFPYIFSIDQACEWAEFMDELVTENELDKKAEQYENNLKELDDFEKALRFNIDIRRAVDGYQLDRLKEKAPSMAGEIEQRKHNEPWNMIPVWITSSLSTCLEPLRSGSTLFGAENLTKEQEKKLEQIKNSYLCKYGNMSMQELSPQLKPKLVERQSINKEWFDNLPLDEKIDFISKMIYESYSHDSKKQIGEKYGELFKPMFDNGAGVNEVRSRAIGMACG